MNNDHAQDDDLSLPAQRRIDRQCLAFEDSWKSGNPQAIETVLQETPEAERTALLRELLLIEIAYRRKRGETPTSEEYEARFPAHAIIIADVFQQGFATVDRSRHADELERGGLHIRCPHCHNPVEIVERAQPAKIACPSCGSVFNLATDRVAADQDAAEAADRRSPRRIAHFELLGLLGEGAFGAVWKAHDTKLNRVVAIKIPRNGQFDSKGTDRFLREAQAPAELHHPNIVAVYEVGRDGDVAYIISEFIEGQTLDGWVEAQGRRLTTREAAELCATIAETLQYAHEHHVVHRDLKPSNIMMDASGQPHLMDFGLAKREAGEITMTIDGQIMGTPAYMSPEQARGEAHLADGRTDVYSLGVILFELLTGERPFRGELRMLLRQVIEDDPPSVRRLNSRVDPNIATICVKCLEKPLERRYVTAEALADDLRHFLAGEPIHARPVGKPERLWRWCKRNPVVAGLTAVVALTLVAGTLISSIFAVQAYTSEKRAVAERDRANKNANRADQKASEANANLEKESEARREADTQKRKALEETNTAERNLYFAQIGQAQQTWLSAEVDEADRILDACSPRFRNWEWGYLRHICHSDLLTLRGSRYGVSGCFSPDGKRIATKDWTDDGLTHVWDATTGQELLCIGSHGSGGGVSYSPDGKRLATCGPGVGADTAARATINIWDARTGRKLLTMSGYSFHCVSFSLDGTRLATANCDETATIWDAENGKELLTVRAQKNAGVQGVCFSPDGKRVATASSDGIGTIWDASSGKKLLTFRGRRSRFECVCFSPDGARVAATGPDETTARIWDASNGKELLTVHGHAGWVDWVCFSPDGSRLATAARDGTTRIWDASSGKELLVLRGCSGALAFSPDGKRLYAGNRIWDVNRSQDEPVLPGERYCLNSIVRFSPDGGRIATTSWQYKIAQVWDATSGQQALVLSGHAGLVHDICFSPDGKWLATGSQDGTAKIWDAASGEEVLALRPQTGEIHGVCFSPDGKWLATGGDTTFHCGYYNEKLGAGTVKIWDLATEKELLAITGQRIVNARAFCFSPDGMRLASTSQDGSVKIWDARNGKELLTFPGSHFNGLSVLCFSPDGKRLAINNDRTGARIWDTTSGKEAIVLRGCVRLGGHACFSPDGKRLAIISGVDSIAELLDTDSGQVAFTLRCHDSGCQLLGVCFSPDGRRLAAISGANTICLWEAAAWQEPAKTAKPTIQSGQRPADTRSSPGSPHDGSHVPPGLGKRANGSLKATARGSWTRKADFPGTSMREPLHFSIGSRGYVGITKFNMNEFWEYDPSNDSWSRKADLPNGFRFQAPSFVIGGRAYIVIGVSVWQYDPNSNKWTRKNDMPGADKRNAFGFSIGNKGYIGGGFYGHNDFYEYAPDSDQWTKKGGIPVLGPHYNDASTCAIENVTFTIGTKAYVTGTNLALWEYDPSTDSWTKRIDSHIATYGTAFSIGQVGYIFNFDGEIWAYDPASDSLALESHFPGTKIGYPAGFSINGKGYVGLGGIRTNNTCTLDPSKAFWEYSPAAPRAIGEGSSMAVSPGGKELATASDKAAALANEILADARKQLPKQSPQLAGQLGTIASSRLKANAFPEAESFLRECLAIRENTEPEAWTTFNTKSMLGAALLGQKKYAAAEPLLLAGYEGMKQREATIPPWDKVRIDEALERLIQLAKAQGKKQEETKWQTELEARKKSATARGSWTRKADFPGTSMREPLHFSIGSKGYVGITEFNRNEFWEYDPSNDSWSRKADLPPGFRFQAPSFVIGGRAYIVIGVSVWQYDPNSNKWTRRNDMPGADKRNAFGFSIGNKGYVGGGFYGKNEFYEYDPASDQWTRKKGIPKLCPFYNDPNVYATGNVTFTIGAKAYVTDANIAIWEYDPSADSWTKKIDRYMSYVVAFSIGQMGCIFDADGEIWEYDPATNHLTLGSPFPGTHVGDSAGFSVNGRAYVGLGGIMRNEGGRRTLTLEPCKAFWEYSPAPRER